MELAIPILALGSLFVMNNQTSEPEPKEGFRSLPNTNIADINYPNESPLESTKTSQLSIVNKYDTPYSYTDKYFMPTYQEPDDAQLSPMDTETVLASGGKMASGSSANGNTMFRSLTGDLVNSSYFQHNNMVPFTKKAARSRLLDENSGESMLDAKLGAGSQHFNKSEQSPLFNPMDNANWVYGTPNASDFIQSRINPSMKMANVKPFAEERVLPGLSGQEGGGFNAGMMARESWMPKTVDELRTDAKPKASEFGLFGHEGPAMSRITERGQMGRMEKNRTETSFELGPERYFTTTGAGKGQTLLPELIQRDVNRVTTSASYTGNASVTRPGTYVEGMYMPSTHIDLGPLQMNPVSSMGQSGAREGDYGVDSFQRYTNNRQTTDSNGEGYFGSIGGAFGAAIAPLLDALRPTRKSNVVGNMRPYQNPRAPVANTYLYNPADRPAATVRDTTQNALQHYNVNANQNGGAYLSTGHQVTSTNRHELGISDYTGIASGSKQPRTYNAEYNQRNNDIKSSTIEGYMVQGNMSLMNGDMNVRQKTDMDKMLVNRVAPTATPLNPYTPDVSMIGKSNASQGLYSNINMDRNEPGILDSLKSNPYTMPGFYKH
jgi:hypothetical protein